LAGLWDCLRGSQELAPIRRCHPVHARRVPLPGGEAHRSLRAVLHRRGREGIGGLGARPPAGSPWSSTPRTGI